MSKQTNPKENVPHPHPTPKSEHTSGTKVITLHSSCMADGCKKKFEKAGFCLEHFDWFKEGLITKEGRRPSDFDKKYFNYEQRKRAA
jgi:hypothetical protein